MLLAIGSKQGGPQKVLQSMACRVTCLSDDSSDDSVGRGLARFAPACDEPHPKKARVMAPRVLALSDDDQDELVPLVKPMPMSAGRKRPFVEVFAGSQHLSDAFRGNGHRVFPMDVKISIDHDMHGASGQVLLLRQLGLLERETGLKPYVHFAPPCSTYSQARYPRIRGVTHPHGLPPGVLTNHDKAVLKHANRITRNTFEVMIKLYIEGYMVSLEQPSTSLMFRTKEFKSWASKSGAAPINVDYCMFGMPYRKRTTLWASPAGFLDELSRTCPGNHQHAVTLSGWSFNKESRLATSRGCSAYPSELCSEWARVFGDARNCRVQR